MNEKRVKDLITLACKLHYLGYGFFLFNPRM